MIIGYSVRETNAYHVRLRSLPYSAKHKFTKMQTSIIFLVVPQLQT